jgi:hypothetical protein
MIAFSSDEIPERNDDDGHLKAVGGKREITLNTKNHDEDYELYDQVI